MHQNFPVQLVKVLVMIRVLTVAVLCGILWAQTPVAEPASPAQAPQAPPPQTSAQTPSTQPPAAVPPSNQSPLPEAKPDPESGPQEQDVSGAMDAAELLPPVPSRPAGKATLVGGTLKKLDRVRDEITIQPFGGRDVRIVFDGRTEIYRDGKEVPPSDLRGGEKIYVDTVLDGTTIFAKNIRITPQRSTGESRGQIMRFDRGKGEMEVNDPLSPKPIILSISSVTKISRDKQPASVADLRTGSLIDIKFRPEGEGRTVASEIDILAQPGTDFTFAGRVTNLDLHSGLLVLVDPRDRKTYEIHFSPSDVHITGNLIEGAEVTVVADFDGTRYATSSIVVNSESSK